MKKGRRAFLSVVVLMIVLSTFVFGEKKITLTYWDHQFPGIVDWTQRMIKEYEKINPNVEIEFSVDYAHERLLPSMYAGTGPDISVPHDAKVVKLMMEGYLAPVRLEAFPEFNSYEDLEKVYFPGVLDLFKKDGKIYGLPLSLEPHMLLINEKLFRMAGIEPTPENIPEHWDEVCTIGGDIFEAIGKNEKGITIYEAFDWEYAYRAAWRRDDLRTIFAQYGAKFVDENGNVVVDSPQAVEAVTMMRDMINKCKTGDPNARPGGEDRSWQLFNGTLAMGVFPGGEIYKTSAAEDVVDYLKVYQFPYPRGYEQVIPVRGHVFMVNGSISEEKQIEAWKFINYLTQQWQEQAVLGQMPPRMLLPNGTPWYETDWFKEQTDKYQSLRNLPLNELAEGKGVWQIGYELYGTDEARLLADEITDIVGDAVDRIIFMNLDVEPQLKEAKKEIEILLK